MDKSPKQYLNCIRKYYWYFYHYIHFPVDIIAIDY